MPTLAVINISSTHDQAGHIELFPDTLPLYIAPPHRCQDLIQKNNKLVPAKTRHDISFTDA